MNQRRSSKPSLLVALRADDAVAFRAILDQQNRWPPYSRWSDYELLLKAAKLGSKRVAWLLLERGARIFKRSRLDAPLHEAAARPGWTDFVKVLLDKGARVADLSCRGDTALHVAFARQRSAELLDLLLRAHLRDGAVDVVNGDGLSLLHIACTRPNLKVVKALLRTGQACVGVQVPMTSSSVYAGFTPLHFAVAFHQPGVVELLLEQYNADVYVQNANGSTPLHLALDRRDVGMIDLILRFENRREDCCNRFGSTHFMAACVGSDEGLVEEYLRVATFHSWSEPETLVASQVQPLQDLPTAGYTPLHFAAEFGRVDTAKMLLKLGARCCATTTSEATPFALACKRNHADVCNLLLGCCEDAHMQPPAKRRRIVVENAEDRFTGLCNSLKRYDASRSGLSDSEQSTLTSSSIPSSPSSCFVESLVTDPRMLCVNPRQVFDQDDASFTWGMPKVFGSYDDVDTRENSSALRDIYSIHNRGVWNFRLDEAECCSIAVPTDVQSDFHEPLDDIILDDNFETACVQSATDDNCSIDTRKALGFTFRESLSNVPREIYADDVEEIVDEQVKFDELFEKYLRRNGASESDEQVKFDELFEKYLRHNSASESDDLESSFSSNADCSLVRETEFTEQKLKNTDSSAIGDTLEVTISSNESGVQEETARSSDEGSSTVVLSSGYGSGCSMKEKTVSFDNQSASSSPERDVEVVFVEVEEFNDCQANYVMTPIDFSVDLVGVEKEENHQTGFRSEQISTSKSLDFSNFIFVNTEVDANDSEFCDVLSVSESRVSSLAPFQCQPSNENQLIVNDYAKPAHTLDFSSF